MSESLSVPGGIDGGSEHRARRRDETAKSLSSTDLMPGVLEALSIAASSYSSGGGEKDQTCDRLINQTLTK